MLLLSATREFPGEFPGQILLVSREVTRGATGEVLGPRRAVERVNSAGHASRIPPRLAAAPVKVGCAQETVTDRPHTRKTTRPLGPNGNKANVLRLALVAARALVRTWAASFRAGCACTVRIFAAWRAELPCRTTTLRTLNTPTCPDTLVKYIGQMTLGFRCLPAAQQAFWGKQHTQEHDAREHAHRLPQRGKPHDASPPRSLRSSMPCTSSLRLRSMPSGRAGHRK